MAATTTTITQVLAIVVAVAVVVSNSNSMISSNSVRSSAQREASVRAPGEKPPGNALWWEFLSKSSSPDGQHV